MLNLGIELLPQRAHLCLEFLRTSGMLLRARASLVRERLLQLRVGLLELVDALGGLRARLFGCLGARDGVCVAALEL